MRQALALLRLATRRTRRRRATEVGALRLLLLRRRRHLLRRTLLLRWLNLLRLRCSALAAILASGPFATIWPLAAIHARLLLALRRLLLALRRCSVALAPRVSTLSTPLTTAIVSSLLRPLLALLTLATIVLVLLFVL